MKNKKILVIGGCRFIGSNFITYMLNKYDDIDIANLNPFTYSSKLENLNHITTNKYKFIKGNISYREFILDLFKEETPLDLSFTYPTSKTSTDLLVNDYYKTYKFNTDIFRCSNNYDPYQCSKKLIPRMIKKALHNKYLHVYGDGLNIRDWLHVDEHYDDIDLSKIQNSPSWKTKFFFDAGIKETINLYINKFSYYIYKFI